MNENLMAKENENFKTGCDFFEKKDYVSALHFFEKSSLDGLNNSCQVLLKKADCHFQLLNYAEAISEYSKVININPGLIPAFINRGNAKTKLGDLSGAIGDYNLAIKLDPSNNLIYFNRAISFLDINEPEKAISDFSIWIQNNPNDSEGYRGRGMAFYNSSNYLNAISDFSKAIEKGCGDNQIYKMRSKSYAMVGEKNKAEADLATANFLKSPDNMRNLPLNPLLKIICIMAFLLFFCLSIAILYVQNNQLDKNLVFFGFGISFSLVFLCFLGFFLYFMPAFIASMRGHHNSTAITILNLFLGWSFVGWVVSLVWAFTSVEHSKPLQR